MRGGANNSILTLESACDEEPSGSGLFLKLFQYTLSKDEHLREIFKSIPKHACYTSTAIQNEIIEVLKEMVLEKAVSDINTADIGYYTLKADETRDPTNTENISIVIRFVKEGQVQETLVSMPTTQRLEAIATTILANLNDCGIDLQKMLSQCYDGASVMSGKKGGVQKKI